MGRGDIWAGFTSIFQVKRTGVRHKVVESSGAPSECGTCSARRVCVCVGLPGACTEVREGRQVLMAFHVKELGF